MWDNVYTLGSLIKVHRGEICLIWTIVSPIEPFWAPWLVPLHNVSINVLKASHRHRENYAGIGILAYLGPVSDRRMSGCVDSFRCRTGSGISAFFNCHSTNRVPKGPNFKSSILPCSSPCPCQYSRPWTMSMSISTSMSMFINCLWTWTWARTWTLTWT